MEEPDSLLEPALHTVLGDGTLLPFCMLTVLFAWLLTRHAVARRFLVVIPLSFLLFLFNPYTAKLVMVHMTGPAFWRSLWAVPMPLFITMILVAPVAMWSSKRRRRLPRLAVAVALFAFAWWVPRFSALSEENGVALHRPGLKVPPIEYDLALQLQAAVPPRAYVVAPNDVNPWIATQNHHPYQLNVRNLLSSSRMRAFLGGAEIERRRTMNSVVSGFLNQKGSLDVFRRGLDAYRIEGVCLKRMPKTPKIRRVLNDLGFHRIYVHGDYELWTRRLEPT